MPDSPSVPLLVLIVFGLMGEAVRRGRSARILSSSEVRACVGALIFAYAGLALHFSMPGPLQFFTSEPTTASIFRFPLALVLAFVVRRLTERSAARPVAG